MSATDKPDMAASRSKCLANLIRHVRLSVVWLIVLIFSAEGFSQVLTDTSNASLTAALAFGTLTAGTSNTPDSQTLQFRIRCSNVAGYKVKVTSATFTPITTAPADGGSTIDASDIGVGIVAVTTPPPFNGILPRNDVITGGFDYDPASITASNGLSPFGGLSGSPARATFQDLISSPDTQILSGNQIHTSESASGANAPKNYLTVTMRFAVLRQYFTPATFSGTITLQISNGP
jgi:hypothetical protein